MIYRIEGKLPGLNELVAASHNHYARAAMKRRYERAAVLQLQAQQARPVESLPVDVHFAWECKDRRRDPDNIASAGQKVLLDALQVAGVLPNDGWHEIASIEHNFKKSELKIDAVTITLTESSPDID